MMEEKEKENNHVKTKFKKCKEIYKEFITNKVDINEEIIDACLFLSRLDLMVRNPFKGNINLNPEDAGDISDLRQLHQNCNLEQFCPKEKIILNPTFGKAPELIGGADADLVIDSTLIDVKTTIELKLTRQYYNQLICYYILYLIGGLDYHPDLKLDSLGIYFSRYDFLWTLPIGQVGNEKDFERAISGLKSSIKKK